MENLLKENSNHLKNECIYNLLKNKILTYSIKPGTVLNERQIALKMGCSRTPIREAFQKLENDGLIKKYPRQGTIVAELTLKDVLEMFQIREFIEPPSAAIVAEKMDDHARQELSDMIKTFNSLKNKEPNKDVYLLHNKMDALMHSFIINKTQNSRLIKLTSDFNDMIQRICYLGTPARFNESIVEHSEIINALLNMECKKAEKLMRVHLLASKKRLIKLMQG